MEADLFVDRHAETAEFGSWLGADSARAQIFQVVGHAGVGKSALLRTFARTAPSLGRSPVAYVDGESIQPTANDFARAITGDGASDPATFLGDQPALLMIDGMDELAPLTRWLTSDLIPSLSGQVRVAIAGRQPVGPMWKPWLGAMRTIRLDSLSRDASAAYLERRGVTPAVAGQILEAAGGYPLALTLAADLAVQLRVSRFEKAAEWNLTLRQLVDQLLRDAPELRSLLEAAAVVRQFDEPTLAAVADLDRAGEAFAQLCAVSFVRPAQHGLTLHEDVRRVVIEELRWRNPERLVQLRRQARGYYRDRIRARRPGEEWLLPDRMYLWEHTVHATYFPTGAPSTMWVEKGGPGDIEELLKMQAEWVAMHQAGVPLPGVPPPEECSPEFLRRVVAHPGTEVLIARSPDGQAHGYAFFLPISMSALELLPPGGAIGTLVERAVPQELRRSLPATAEGSRVLYMSVDAARGERAAEAIGALATETFGFALRGIAFVGCVAGEMAAQACQAIGMTRIPNVGTTSVGPPQPLDGWIVDIGRIGPDVWLEAVTTGRPVPPALSAEELEAELHQVLVHWPDDARLAQSPLALLAPLLRQADDTASPAQTLRETIRRALGDACADASDDLALACRALELAYFERKAGHEAIAERLNVSRSTFYRLLHRAEHEIALRLRLAPSA
jgi:hypothetical protein